MEWNITNTEDLGIYSEKILKMYENSYREIGLIDFGGWEGLKKYLNCSCYLLVDTTKELNGIILYWLSEYGNKISLVISKTPDIGKTYIIPKLIELLRTPGFYIELSDALEYLVRKNGLDNIKDKTIIKILIPHLTDEDIFNEGDERCIRYPLNKKNNTPSPSGSYMREIKDIGLHRKALYGLPCLSKVFDNDKCDRKCLSGGGKKTIYKKRQNTKKNISKSLHIKYNMKTVKKRPYKKRSTTNTRKFLYNPDNPKISFDVYIDKNPEDTIPIKYTTLQDVKNTINKLEILYKNKKISA